MLGNGDAAGMFPIDIATKKFNEKMMDQFDELTAEKNFPWKIREILPEVLVAGEDAGVLTEEGTKLLDPTGTLTVRNSNVSSGRRCRNRNGCNEQRCCPYRKCFCRNKCICNGSI